MDNDASARREQVFRDGERMPFWEFLFRFERFCNGGVMPQSAGREVWVVSAGPERLLLSIEVGWGSRQQAMGNSSDTDSDVSRKGAKAQS